LHGGFSPVLKTQVDDKMQSKNLNSPEITFNDVIMEETGNKT